MVTIKRKNKNQLIWGSNSLVINKIINYKNQLIWGGNSLVLNKNLVLMYVYSFIIIS